MLLRILHFLDGTVRVRVESAFPERILNLCADRGIRFWQMCWCSPTEFVFCLRRRDFLRLRRAVQKTDCILTVDGRRGVPFFLHRFRRRYVLVAGLGLAMVGLFFGSFFIWDFRVEGNRTVSDEAILRALEKEGVEYGTFGLSIDPEKLKNHILLELPKLSWLTVNVTGCRATVLVRERTVPPPIPKEKENANVIAAKDALVTRVQLFGGHAEVLAGATVRQGQLLISGVADIDQRGVYFTRGEGRIYGRTWYTLRTIQPAAVTEKVYTGKEKTVCALLFGKDRIKISFGSSISYTNYDKITTRSKWILPGGIALPLTLSRETYREYIPRERVLTEDEAKQRAEEVLRSYLDELLDDDGTVTAAAAEISGGGREFAVCLQAECAEQIGKSVALPN